MTRSPSRPGYGGASDGIAPKPYELIPFPKQRPFLKPPAGHHCYRGDRQHGTLHLTLDVKTPLHVSTGVIAMGSDVGQSVPLIKTMTQTGDALVIQGSSLKGCVRAIYETITNSTMGVITPPHRKNMSPRYRRSIPRERQPCSEKERLCPASQVFGALNWQGIVSFNDARCQQQNLTVGFMPLPWSPKSEREGYYERNKLAGRKFYYHARRAVEGSKHKRVTVQQAARTYQFKTKIQYMNLQDSELGALLIALGQDDDHGFALKIGGGKPIGMGSMTVVVDRIEQAGSLRDRYTSYEAMSTSLEGKALASAMVHMIGEAHKGLIEAPQLRQLAQVLRYPTNRNAPSGMY